NLEDETRPVSVGAPPGELEQGVLVARAGEWRNAGCVEPVVFPGEVSCLLRGELGGILKEIHVDPSGTSSGNYFPSIPFLPPGLPCSSVNSRIQMLRKRTGLPWYISTSGSFSACLV